MYRLRRFFLRSQRVAFDWFMGGLCGVAALLWFAGSGGWLDASDTGWLGAFIAVYGMVGAFVLGVLFLLSEFPIVFRWLRRVVLPVVLRFVSSS